MFAAVLNPPARGDGASAQAREDDFLGVKDAAFGQIRPRTFRREGTRTKSSHQAQISGNSATHHHMRVWGEA